jgi:hypothetical protein
LTPRIITRSGEDCCYGHKHKGAASNRAQANVEADEAETEEEIVVVAQSLLQLNYCTQTLELVAAS